MYYDYIWKCKLRNVLIEKFLLVISLVIVIFIDGEDQISLKIWKGYYLIGKFRLESTLPSRLASIRGARLQGRCDVPQVTLNVASCQRSVTSSLHSCFTHRVNHVTFALGIIPLDSNNSRIIIFFSNLPIFLYDRSNATISSPSSIILE